jgi:hypothetical protein
MAKMQHCPTQVQAWAFKMKITQLSVTTVGFKGQVIKINACIENQNYWEIIYPK